MKIIRWITRLIALLMSVFGLFFYFGYGHPLPFTNPDYTFFDNLWLTIFPIIFIGLILGWRKERVGGCLIVLSIFIGMIISFLIGQDFSYCLLAPLLVGISYLLLGWRQTKI